MTRSHALFAVLAGIHLFLVVCGATKKPLLPREHPASDTLRIYGAVSGSDSHYGFFAPEVGPQIRVVFLLTDANGKTRSETPGEGLNPEASLRAGSTTSVFNAPEMDDATRKALLASWADGMFAKHPDVEKVTIRLEIFDPLTMSEYQQGKRPAWKLMQQFGPFDRGEMSEMESN